MLFHRRMLMMWVMTVLMIPTVVLGQGDVCALLVQNALATTDDACLNTGRNQACYGSTRLAATLQPDATNVRFDAPGDLIDLVAVQRLALNSYDAETQEWGVALLRVQANLPDTLPGQNVTFILFGDVEIEDSPTPDDPNPQPMQAFFFRSGFGDAPCESAPNSGILIQTPEGIGQINLRVNEVDITLGSTTFLQTLQPIDEGDEISENSELIINGLEGNVMASVEGVMQNAVPGTRVRVPLDADLMAAGPPSPPEPFDERDLLALPLSNLEREIKPPAPLSADAISTLSAPAPTSGGIPLSGVWIVTLGGDCAAFNPGPQTANLTVSGDGASFVVAAVEGNIPFTRNADGTYTGFFEELAAYTLTDVSPDLMSGEFSVSDEGFTFVCPFELVRES